MGARDRIGFARGDGFNVMTKLKSCTMSAQSEFIAELEYAALRGRPIAGQRVQGQDNLCFLNYENQNLYYLIDNEEEPVQTVALWIAPSSITTATAVIVEVLDRIKNRNTDI